VSKNLSHMTSIQEAAQELHKMLLGTPWYIRIQVMSQPPTDRSAVTDKQEKRDIVVFVRTKAALGGPLTTFKSWPVRYELGA
jgi:hypothetical protein